MNEKYIEKSFIRKVNLMGGMALKFVSPGMDGVPDRIVLLKMGKTAFVEVKAPGKKLRPLQERRKKQLEKIGFKVYILDSIEKIGGIINEIQSS